MRGPNENHVRVEVALPAEAGVRVHLHQRKVENELVPSIREASTTLRSIEHPCPLCTGVRSLLAQALGRGNVRVTSRVDTRSNFNFHQRSATAGTTSRPMISRGVIRSTFGTAPITVSTPISPSQRNCPSSCPTFWPSSPTSKANAQVFSIES